MKHVRSIAAAQTVPRRGDVDANREEHLRLIRLAARKRARVVVFPELSLTGYELDLAEQLAFSENDPRLDPVVEASASCGVIAIVGAPVRIAGRLHIGAFIVHPDGSVGLYTKHHLGAFPAEAGPDGVVPPPESTVFEPGDRDPVLQLDGHSAAVAVCADTGRASHAADAARRGARTYLASMFFTPPELDEESARLGGHAARHSMAVAMANFGGPSGGLPAAGGSSIWSDNGELLARLGRTGPGVVVAREGEGGWRATASGTGAPLRPTTIRSRRKGG